MGEVAESSEVVNGLLFSTIPYLQQAFLISGKLIPRAEDLHGPIATQAR